MFIPYFAVEPSLRLYRAVIPETAMSQPEKPLNFKVQGNWRLSAKYFDDLMAKPQYC